jgi:UDP-GlcNAc:undecaprenyl-phosphate GlcNAc-1-phosphate transferase
MGAVILICLGVVDDIVALSAKLKLLVQLIAAAIPAVNGVTIEFFHNPLWGEDSYLHFGVLAVPVTILWIVGIVNAVNLIDGLDGLAVGISSIASTVMLAIAILVSEPYVALAMAALLGACLGFLPFNFNPARIFMGDTGSMFLGYVLATLSIQGFFKIYAVISFAVPFLILGLPIFDTAFAIVRRLAKGQSPFHADRGHVHHRLIDLGFDQKQAVTILYAISAVLGLLAVVLAASGESKVIFLALAAMISFYISIHIRKMGNAARKESPKGEDLDDDK